MGRVIDSTACCSCKQNEHCLHHCRRPIRLKQQRVEWNQACETSNADNEIPLLGLVHFNAIPENMETETQAMGSQPTNAHSGENEASQPTLNDTAARNHVQQLPHILRKPELRGVEYRCASHSEWTVIRGNQSLG